MKPVYWIITGAAIAVFGFASQEVKLFSDLVMNHFRHLFLVFELLYAGIIQAGVIIAIIGVWKLWKQRKAKTDPSVLEEKPVSMTRQTIYALIPILDLYAAYKIKKFWVLFAILVAFWMFLGSAFAMLGDLGLGYPNDMIFPMPFEILVTVFLIREWSKRWNKKFETSVMN